MRRLALTLLTALLPVAGANSYAPPSPMLVGSDYGGYGFKFLPKGVNIATASAKESWGELFQLRADGTLKTLWKHQLVNAPSRVLISPRGQVVTLDNWAGYGSPAHAVVVYDQQGKVVADLSFSQVMNGQSCTGCGSMDGPFLQQVYTPKFTSYGNQDEWFLLLRDDKGKGPAISLKTGKLKT